MLVISDTNELNFVMSYFICLLYSELRYRNTTNHFFVFKCRCGLSIRWSQVIYFLASCALFSSENIQKLVLNYAFSFFFFFLQVVARNFDFQFLLLRLFLPTLGDILELNFSRKRMKIEGVLK